MDGRLDRVAGLRRARPVAGTALVQRELQAEGAGRGVRVDQGVGALMGLAGVVEPQADPHGGMDAGRRQHAAVREVDAAVVLGDVLGARHREDEVLGAQQLQDRALPAVPLPHGVLTLRVRFLHQSLRQG